MEVHIHSVKAKSLAGNRWVKEQWQDRKAKEKRKSVGDLKILYILPENSAEARGSRREHYWVYVSI